MKKTFWLSLSLLLSGAFAQGTDPQPRLSQLIDTLHDTQAFMGTVIITQKGKTTFEKSVGLANLEKSIPNTSDTVYRVASITKSFVGVAVLKLQEEGKLKVTDPLSKYLPDYPNGENITLHHLITHTSGIFNYFERTDLASLRKERPSLEEFTKKFANEPVNFAPGAMYRYNNSGYILLGRVIEKASGMPFETYMQQHVLAPMGFEKTRFYKDDQVVAGRAEGYTPSGEGFEKADLFNYEVVHAAGGLSATPRELVQWLPGILSGKLLSPESVQAFMAPHVVLPGAHYGYGVVVAKLLGKDHLNHSGELPGGSSFMAYFPEEQISVVMLSNVTRHDLPALFTRVYLAYNRNP
ncbi:serine hydrolase domain-containing protein [Deinococcus cellulosilyticus]|uniref:Serine hydrolase n=1 Tax=Deinococcus cellulosilyticus (strain DSM 18568 / NBRC 106333 / KACC 11606 / 5516J-15) TaxID=1223518 RepID=A0A511MYD1_DEIC1|nr:serine hydrolase domain-containing protein [Deinococcus cellulosilyticus]GEM45592.1 serine hydrolase [Deinococcus cellulosilyticus NBRC 106333 = KACC 11606]